MKMSPFEPITAVTAAPLLIAKANVDTDQILPARFLTTTTREGMGKLAFYDWRHDEHGEVIEHEALNSAPKARRRIVVAGHNFGCGSSREHAPWALYDYGVRVVLGEQLADIFKTNCRKNGIAAIDITKDIFELICANRSAEISVRLDERQLQIGQLYKGEFDMDELSRTCLMSGDDQLGVLLNALPEIEKFERTHVHP